MDILKIKGEISKDYRGHIRFANGFDMMEVKRFYIIRDSDTEIIRGWRAHRIEQRWFYVLSGTFIVNLIKIDNWESPSSDLTVVREILKSEDMVILYVPPGYAMAFRSLDCKSELLVYADHDISHAELDDYTWPANYFSKSNVDQCV